MHTDPFVTLVFFAAALIVACVAGAIYVAYCERRDRREARELGRDMRRAA